MYIKSVDFIGFFALRLTLRLTLRLILGVRKLIQTSVAFY